MSYLRGNYLRNYQGGSDSGGGPILLEQYDFSTPLTQEKPTTQAALRTALGQSSVVVEEIFDFEEASGTPTGKIAGITLDSNTQALIGQPAYGLFNGSDAVSYLAVEAQTGIAQLSSSTTADLDRSTGAFAFGIIFRSPVVGFAAVFDKYDTGIGRGYHLRINASGHLEWQVVGASGGIKVTVATAGHDNGAWHFAVCGRDSSGDLFIYSDLNTTAATSGVATGDCANGRGFTLGRLPSLINTGPGVQISYLFAVDGNTTDALADNAASVISSFFQHGGDPSGKLSTADLNVAGGARGTVVGAGAVGLWSMQASGNRNQVPLGWDALRSIGAKFGVAGHGTQTNLLDYSEDFTQWTSTNTIYAPRNSNSVWGFLEATLITASAANGHSTLAFAGAAGAEYTFHVWVRCKNGTVDGEIRIDDDVGNVATQAFTATTDWQLVSCTGTTDAGSTSWACDIQIDTNSEAVLASAANCYAGTFRRQFVRTTGASATASMMRFYIDPAYIPNGLVAKAAYVCHFEHQVNLTASTDHAPFYVDEGTGTTRQLRTASVSATELNVLLYDDAGSVWYDQTTSVTPSGAEAVVQVEHDQRAADSISSGVTVEHYYGATSQATDNDVFTVAGDPIDFISIGNQFGSASPLNGDVARLQIYNRPLKAAA